MFALAISSTQPTLPSSTSSEVRLLRVSCSRSGTSFTLRPVCSPGCCCSMPFAIVFICACACSSETPGRMRATTMNM